MGLEKFRHKKPIPDEKKRYRPKTYNPDVYEAEMKGNIADVFPIGNPKATFKEES